LLEIYRQLTITLSENLTIIGLFAPGCISKTKVSMLNAKLANPLIHPIFVTPHGDPKTFSLSPPSTSSHLSVDFLVTLHNCSQKTIFIAEFWK